MKNNSPSISVILSVYNDAEPLRHCLDALEKQSYPKDSYEVVVIDDGSDENIKEITTYFRQTIYIRQNHQGTYASRNKGISVAKGEILAFTDADCIPASDWIQKGSEALLGEPECGVIGGKIEIFFKNPDNPTTVEFFESMFAFAQRKYIKEWKFAAAANMFTFKDVFGKVGLFNGTLKSGGDVEWGNRVFKANYRLIFKEDVRVAHAARRYLRDLIIKHKRVSGGLYNIYKENHRSLNSFIIYLKNDWPQIKDFRAIYSTKKLKKISQRIGVIFIMLVIKIVRIMQNIQLRMHDERL